jgi:hypothetical protein
LLGTASVALLLAWTTSAGGQHTSLPYDLLLSLDQLETLRQAWNDGLSYVPGEVLVKFRDDATTAQKLRTMTQLPGKVESTSTRRIGAALLMKFVDEPDAYGLASTLRSQPEVIWAQPNYLRRL